MNKTGHYSGHCTCPFTKLVLRKSSMTCSAQLPRSVVSSGERKRGNPRSWSLEKKWPVPCSLVLINSKGDTDTHKAALWKWRVSHSPAHYCFRAHEACLRSAFYSSANFKTAISQKENSMNPGKTGLLLKVPRSFHGSEILCLIIMPLD